MAITFNYKGRVYSVTRIVGNKVHACKTLRGKRLRGHPRYFDMANLPALKVR